MDKRSFGRDGNWPGKGEEPGPERPPKEDGGRAFLSQLFISIRQTFDPKPVDGQVPPGRDGSFERHG